MKSSLTRAVARFLEREKRWSFGLSFDPIRDLALPTDRVVIGVGGATLGGSFRTPVAIALTAALPGAVLVLSLRRWRPLPVAALVLVLATVWNLGPHAWALSRSAREHEAASALYWAPAAKYLRQHLGPSYRVEAVDTAGH